MKITLSMILDLIFYFVVLFIVSFILLNYFFDRRVAMVLAICFSALIELIIFKKVYGKRQKILLNKKQEKLCEKVVLELNFSTVIEQHRILEQALCNSGYTIKKRKTATIVQDKNAAIFMHFGFDPVTKTDVVKCYNNILKEETAYIISENFSTEVKNFAERFNSKIVLVDGKTFFMFLSKNDSLPEERFSDFNIKEKKASLKNLFSKKQSKNFFFFGLIFLGMSYFVPFNAYYVVWGCCFLIFSVIIKLFGKEEISPTK